jgi:hypothetical protein
LEHAAADDVFHVNSLNPIDKICGLLQLKNMYMLLKRSLLCLHVTQCMINKESNISYAKALCYVTQAANKLPLLLC